jgi:hypothetical protein
MQQLTTKGMVNRPKTWFDHDDCEPLSRQGRRRNEAGEAASGNDCIECSKTHFTLVILGTLWVGNADSPYAEGKHVGTSMDGSA